MAEKITEKDLFSKPVSDMSEAERMRAIERLELLRDEVIYQIEDIMEEAAAESGQSRFKKRRFPIGESPNDN